MFKTQKTVSAFKDFQILSKLGEGAYSIVFKARRESDNQIYALKKVKMDSLTEKERENALNEVRILASISDPFIIGYKEAFFDEDSNNLCIIMEYAEQGDLQKRLKEYQSSKKNIPEKEIWKCLIYVSKALHTLHSLQILHRDLKSANVFIANDGFLKLGDLNVSKIATQGLVYTQTGTPYYASPEVWRDEPYDIKSDIWSLGCVLYEMAALKPPFQASDMSLLYKKVQKGTIERIPQCYSNDLFNIICNCLKVNPIDRPFAFQILKNPNVMSYIKNDEAYKLLNKNSKVNLLNKIEVPHNLAILKERLPKPNYEKIFHTDSDNEEISQNNENKKIKIRIASADTSKRNNLMEKTQLINHLKNQKLKNDIRTSQAINLNNSPIGNSILSRISKNNNNINIISKNINQVASALQNTLTKSPSLGSPPITLKLPSIVKSPNNQINQISKSPNMNIFNIKRPFEKSPLIVKKNSSANNELNRISKELTASILEKQRLGLIRPFSQGIPKTNNNNNNDNIFDKKMLNNNGILASPSIHNMIANKNHLINNIINGSQSPYKIVLKNRPLSHNNLRNEPNPIITEQPILRKEEQSPQVGEEKDIGRITNKLRPLSCNSNIKRIEQQRIEQNIIAPAHLQINNKNNIFNPNNFNYNVMVSKHINSNHEEFIHKQNNMIINNRGLLYNQKPVTAPNIGRESARIIQNNNINNNYENHHNYNNSHNQQYHNNYDNLQNSNNAQYNLQNNDKNLPSNSLYSKQALEMLDKLNSQKSHFTNINLKAANAEKNYNILQKYDYYNK